MTLFHHIFVNMECKRSKLSLLWHSSVAVSLHECSGFPKVPGIAKHWPCELSFQNLSLWAGFAEHGPCELCPGGWYLTFKNFHIFYAHFWKVQTKCKICLAERWMWFSALEMSKGMLRITAAWCGLNHSTNLVEFIAIDFNRVVTEVYPASWF